MKTIEFEEVNVRYAENQPEYETLPAFRHPDDEQGCVISCWQFEQNELAKVQKTGVVWMHVLTFNKPLQPLLLSVDNPFITEEEIIESAKETIVNKHFLQLQAYSTKNKAHEEIQNYVRQWHNAIIDDGSLKNMVNDIEKEISRINTKHARCKDISLSINSYTENTIQYSVFENFYLVAHKVRREELSQKGVTG